MSRTCSRFSHSGVMWACGVSACGGVEWGGGEGEIGGGEGEIGGRKVLTQRNKYKDKSALQRRHTDG